MRNHPVLNFLVFTCFLVVGYTLSIRFYQPDAAFLSSSFDKVTMEQQPGIAALDNGQRSILLVGASAINTTSPHLESLWMVTYLPSDTTIRLLPIFSSGEKSISSLGRQLELSFSLRKEAGGHKLGKDFLSLLEKNNYWWSGYIIYDEVSFTNITELLGGTQDNGITIADYQILSDVPNVMEDPANGYSEQISIFQSLCHKFLTIDTKPDTTQLSTIISDHIFTDMDANQLQMELETLFSNHQVRTCRFPTLEISRVEP